MANIIDIKNLSKAALGEEIKILGEESYRARQIFKWLYKFGVKSFDEMTDIPAALRQKLASHFHITRLVALDSRRSSDGTVKHLFKLEDGNTIETVLIPDPKRNTACLSSQVGCKYACSFCASAPFGFVRNLTRSEIVEQAVFLRSKNEGIITNLVFMGIGEPLDNYDNVMDAIRVFNDKDAFSIGARKITISTCGIIPGIERLKREKLQIELSVSLHSADDRVRSTLLPVNKRYPLKELIATCKSYAEDTGRIVTFEYVLIRNVNSSDEAALKLAGLLKGIACKVNTILYNQIAAKDYSPASKAEERAFIGILKKNGINAVSRRSRGEDIDAGCGQLRISRLWKKATS